MLGRKGLLGVGSSIVVDHALDVAGCHRSETDRLNIPEQSHRNARFIAVRVRQNDTGFVRFGFQYGSDQRVELRINEHHGLGMSERVESHACAEIDGTRHFHDQID